MIVYTINALKFPDENAQNEDSQYVVQRLKNKFTLWEDHFGELECGEDPTHSDIDITECRNLKEIRNLLLEMGYISDDTRMKFLY